MPRQVTEGYTAVLRSIAATMKLNKFRQNLCQPKVGDQDGTMAKRLPQRRIPQITGSV